MKIKFSIYSLLLISLLSPCVYAVETTYGFDTVTSIDINYGNYSGTDQDQPEIIGIEKDTGDVINISFYSRENIADQYKLNRCIPIFLTAIEKPGKYYLYITLDRISYVDHERDYMTGCRLALK